MTFTAKRILALLLTLVFLCAALLSCAEEPPEWTGERPTELPAPYAAWGSMIEQFFKSVDVDPVIFMQHFNVWAAPGICIVIAVLGFNFVGDGLRDALDPKMRK